MHKKIKSHFAEIFRVLNLFSRDELNFLKLEAVAELIQKVKESGGKILTIGHDLSLNNAHYFASSLKNTCNVESRNFTDFSAGNNSEPDYLNFIEAQGAAGDLLVWFSANQTPDFFSRIATKAIETDMIIVLFTGNVRQNTQTEADITVFAPETPGAVRTIELQTVMIHALCDAVHSKLQEIKPNSTEN